MNLPKGETELNKGMFTPCWLALAVLMLACSAGAEIVSYTGFIPGDTTNWTYDVSLPRFDPALGVLESVTFTLCGEVYGIASFESLAPASSSISLDLSASIALDCPGATAELLVEPTMVMVESVGPYDGLLDWEGASGRRLGFRADRSENTRSEVLLTDLEGYIGKGSIIVPVSANAVSRISGPGNLQSDITTIAEADVTVAYDYIIPEPGALISLGVGVTGLWGLSIRRRRNQRNLADGVERSGHQDQVLFSGDLQSTFEGIRYAFHYLDLIAEPARLVRKLARRQR